MLARTFEHGRMKSVCEKALGSVKFVPPFAQRTRDNHLHGTAQMFILIQQSREDAGYDVTSDWAQSVVIDHIDMIEAGRRSARSPLPASSSFSFSAPGNVAADHT